MRALTRLVRAAALVAPLSACMVGPDFVAPEQEVPVRFAAADLADLPAPPADGEAAWWRRAGDPVLEELVERAIARNLDVEIARSRVREARALAGQARSDRLPTIDAESSGSGSSRWTHERGDSGTRRGGAAANRGRDWEVERSASLEGGLSFGWDLDLFGGLRRRQQAALAAALEREFLQRDALLSVVAEVGSGYVDLRGAQRRLALALESLGLQQHTLELVRSRVDAGLAPALDRVRAEASVAALEADIAPLRTQIGRSTDALAVLVAEPPGTLAELLGAPMEVPVTITMDRPGEPAELMRARPDIRAAEAALAAATSEIGVATAALYPSLSLPGSITAGISGLGAATVVETVLASLSAVLDIPLFDAGGRLHAVDATEERAQQALLVYRQTLLTALQEVESALRGIAGAAARVRALEAAVAANEQAYAQAQSLYTQGLTSFIDVLDSQRTLTATRQTLEAARTELALEGVALHRALGRGEPEAAPAAQS